MVTSQRIRLSRHPTRLHVSVITFLLAGHKFVHLSLVTDLYCRKIAGWDVSGSLAIEGASRAARQALKSCSSSQGLIRHFDCDVRYCCQAYTGILRIKQVTI